MADWTAPAFIDSFVAQLAARTGITSLTDPTVTVIDYWPGDTENLGDVIIVGYSAADTNEPAAIGQGRYEETVTLSCHIRVVRPGAGTTVAKTARDRAAGLLGEVDNQLRTTFPEVGDQTIAASVTRRQMDQFPSTAGGTGVRVCVIEFDVEYRARTPKTS